MAPLARKSSLLYGSMTIIGLAALRYGHHTLHMALGIPQTATEVARLVLTGLVGAGLLHVLGYFFEDWFASFRELKSRIMHFLGPASALTALYLALITSFGEELLFRGALQPVAGLVLTSVLFGMLHVGKDGLVSAWSVWATIAGLLLGWMYQETASLWPPVVAHFGVNAVSMLTIRRAYRSYAARAEGGDGC